MGKRGGQEVGYPSWWSGEAIGRGSPLCWRSSSGVDVQLWQLSELRPEVKADRISVGNTNAGDQDRRRILWPICCMRAVNWLLSWRRSKAAAPS